MHTNYIQITIDNVSEEQSGILIAQLSELGFDGFEEHENSLKAFTNEDQFPEEALKEILEELQLTYNHTCKFEDLIVVVKSHPKLRSLQLFGNWHLSLKKKGELKKQADFLYQFLKQLPQLQQFAMDFPNNNRYDKINRAICQVMKHRRHFFLAFTEESQTQVWNKWI